MESQDVPANFQKPSFRRHTPGARAQRSGVPPFSNSLHPSEFGPNVRNGTGIGSMGARRPFLS